MVEKMPNVPNRSTSRFRRSEVSTGAHEFTQICMRKASRVPAHELPASWASWVCPLTAHGDDTKGARSTGRSQSPPAGCFCRAPHHKWTTETTSMWTQEGWLDLAVVLDWLYRLVVGWAMAARQDAPLGEKAWDRAVARRCPQAGLLHHSDRGRTSSRES